MSDSSSQPSRRDFLRLCTAGAAGLSLAKSAPRGISVGLDIGTSKMSVAVADSVSDGRLRILGLSQVPSQGITHHGVVDAKAAAASLCAALVQAEAASSVMIRRVVLGVVGMKIAPDPDGPGWERIMSWEEPCHVDEGNGVLRRMTLDECQGRSGIAVVAGAGNRIGAVSRCLESLAVRVEHSILAPAATGCFILKREQQRQGALVIDIGAGTTDYAVFLDGRLAAADCLARGLERIAGDSAITSTFRFIRCHLHVHGIRMGALRAGVHLVGGGALQERLLHCARKEFGRNVQVGSAQGLLWPANAPKLNPAHAAVLGLVKWHQHLLSA